MFFLQGHSDGTSHYLVQAKLAVLRKQFKEAEAILLERGEVDKAMAMYMDVFRWEDAIAVAQSRVSHYHNIYQNNHHSCNNL